MRAIQSDLKKCLENAFIKKHPILGPISSNWGKIVGVKFQKHTHPFKISIQKEKNIKKIIMYVAIYNHAIGTEFSFYQDIIIERIAICLGYKAIHAIKIILHNCNTKSNN